MSCIISNQKFVDNLLNYTLTEEDGILSISYAGGPLNSIDIKIAELFALEPNPESYWKPIFITPVNSTILTKKVNRNFTTNLENKLGIENFLTFNPEFKHWDTYNTSMSLDWFLTDDNFAFSPAYGLLGWIRLAGEGEEGIVFDEDRNIQLYISDGDFFSYHKTTTEKIINYVNRVFSASFVSSTLSKDYQHIYDIISKSISYDIMSTRRYPFSRYYPAINKLATLLSTHPLRDRITQELLLLDDIKQDIIDFVQPENGPFDADNEILVLQNINRKIFSVIRDDPEKEPNIYFNNVIEGTVYSDYSNGFITQKSDLFLKLISKYDPYLYLGGSPIIEYKDPISPHLYINHIMTNHCNRQANGQVLYNNLKFEMYNKAGSYYFETVFDSVKSEYNIYTRTPEENTKYYIPLFDSGKFFPLFNIDLPIGMSAGPDIHIPVTAGTSVCGVPEKFNGFSFDPDADRLTSNIEFPEYQIDKDTISRQLGGLFPFFDIDSIAYKWELINGNKDGITIKNPETLDPTFTFQAFGKYTIQLTATLDTLNIRDTIDIYVVNETGCNVGVDENGIIAFKREEKEINELTGVLISTTIVDDAVDYIKPREYASGQISEITFNRNRSGKLDIYFDYRNAIAIEIPNDRNICKVPNITEVLFSKYGAVNPIKTNSYISVVTTAIIANEDGQSDSNNYVARLDSAKRYNKFYYKPVKTLSESLHTFRMSYNTGNTIIKLYKITLEKLRDKDTGRCRSIYRNSQYQVKRKAIDPDNPRFETVYERDIPDGVHDFQEFQFDNAKREVKKRGIHKLYRHPELSDYGVTINAFGGNGGNPFDIHVPGLQITDIMLPKTYKDDTVKGHDLTKDPVICYLREAEIFSSTDITFDYPAYNPNIKFIKGTFHPDIGFDSNTNGKTYFNKTSSLKFNTGNRTTFTFQGPGFFNSLKGGSGNKSRSPITVDIAKGVFDIIRVSNAAGTGSSENLIDANDTSPTSVVKEDDIDIHHGYRVMSDKPTKLPRDSILYDEYYGSYGSYGLLFRGRRFGDSVQGRIQGSNLLFARIRNIEVKLNFLNQVNLKNARIWIDFNACAYIGKEVTPVGNDRSEFRSDPFFTLTSLRNNQAIVSNVAFDDQQMKLNKTRRKPSDFLQHKAIAQYLLDLQKYNQTSTGFYTLYLLNQEHVESNGIDTVLHFSDRFSKHLAPRNYNTNYAINKDQKVNTTNYIKLQPTLALPDSQYQNTDEYISAIKNNDIFLAVNNFVKFFNQPLFMGSVQETDPPGTMAKPESQISVGLNIEVFNEYDMTNLDVVSELDSKTDYDATTLKQASDSIFNSLCSWEIILHTDTDGFSSTDSLGQINYGWEPHIPGYNFISDDINIKNKLPKSVIDAPNQCLNDLSTCYYDQNTEKEFTFSPLKTSVRFPSEVILMGIAGALLAATSGVMGALASTLAAGFAFAGIVRFLGSLRQAAVTEQLNQAFVRSVYTDRGYGGSDKILLNIGVNGPITYDLEASIYKYSNTPLLKRKVRKYIKTSQIKELSRFDVISISSLEDFLTPYEFEDTSKLEYSEDGKPVGLKINEDITIKPNMLVQILGVFYVSSVNEWEILDNTNIPLHILTYNNLLGLDIEQYNKMIMIPGTRAYNYFEVDQVINSESGGSYQISAKGKAIKNNIEYTILQFYDLAPNDGDSIFIDDKENNNIIVWTDKESDRYNCKTSTSKINNTLFPQATYGNSTPVIQSEFLSNQLKQNDVPSIYDIFNNQECNVKPTNRIEIFSTENEYADIIEPRKAEVNFAYNLGAYDAPDILQGLTSGPTHQLTAGYSYNLYNILDPKNRLSSNFIHMKSEDDDSGIDFSYLLSNIHNNGPDSPNIVELNNSTFSGIANSGYIVVEGDYELGYATSLENGTVENIMERLSFLDSEVITSAVGLDNMTIYELKEKILQLPEDDIGCITSEFYSKPKCPKFTAELELSKLINEKNTLLNVLDSLGVIYNSNYKILYNPLNDDIIPHKTINLNYKGQNYPTTIQETIDNDRYWINIDPEQWCKTSRDSSIKILVEAKYTCWPSTSIVAGNLGSIPALDRDAQNICPTETKSGESRNVEFESAGNVFTYRFPDQEINRQKQRYATKYGIPLNQWEELVFPGPFNISKDFDATRSFFIRPGENSRDIYIEVKETYLVPTKEYYMAYIANPNLEEADEEEGPTSTTNLYKYAYGEYSGKVKDIIPDKVLNSSAMVCRSKVIPRKLRAVDTAYTKYRTDANGNYVETLPSVGPGGPFTSNIALWHCLKNNTYNHTTIPDYFKIKNEMIYRSYFGSTDNIEHIDNTMNSLDPFEWIPYEYHPGF